MTHRQTTPHDARGMRILLVASLAVNLLFVGLAAGVTLRHANASHPSRLELAGGPMTRALAAEDRREVARAIRRAWREAEDGRADLRQSYVGLVADLRAAPFDPAQVTERLREHRARFAVRLRMGQRVLVRHLSHMSEKRRSAYADRLEDRITSYRREDR